MANSDSFPIEWLSRNTADADITLPNYMKAVFDDLLSWPDLLYLLAIGEGGAEITRAVKPDGTTLDKPSIDTKVFYNFSSIVEDYLTRVKQPKSANITIELEEEMLMIAELGGLTLVALFNCPSEQGLMSELIYQRVSGIQNRYN